jgi:aspartyl-tRNA(Asn)/glutamyl-tRNA(Gln) amidotransferase subunit B
VNCSVNRQARFARKNYFYPDLPKGYQISQYELPFCENGCLEIPGDNGLPYSVGIKRIHLEEDAGKLVHSSGSFETADYSLVDYNRSSVPLLEIVTDHERNHLRSVNEARVYLEKLRQTLRYLEVSDCIIEKGQFRCDVNISIRPKGTREFGNRAEVKNMASFRFIMDALEYEIKRQSKILKSGGRINQETRLFDEKKKITLPMRTKEDAPDYRYFPDPDLAEVEIDQEFIQVIREGIPELPDSKADRLIDEYGMSKNDALILIKDKKTVDYFEASAGFCRDRKKLGRWIIKDLFKLLKEAGLPMDKCPVKPKDFSLLINHIETGDITERIARTVLEEMFKTGTGPESIIDKKGLRPIQDTSALEKILDEVMSEHPKVVDKIAQGETNPVGFLIGEVMKKTNGRAHPAKTKELIYKRFPNLS